MVDSATTVPRLETRPAPSTAYRFATLSPNPVGATNATSNLQVGATNSMVESATVPAPAVQTAVEITQPGALATIGYASPQAMLPQSPQAAASAGGLNLGAARFDVVNARGPGDTRSLGEVVPAMRQHPKPGPVRSFTNEDVEKLSGEQQTPQKRR